MNLVRLGHYFTPRGSGNGLVEGACQTALVCGVNADADEKYTDGTVNLHIWRLDGVPLGAREGVPVQAPDKGEDSFHLSGECPWKR